MKKEQNILEIKLNLLKLNTGKLFFVLCYNLHSSNIIEYERIFSNSDFRTSSDIKI